MAKEDIDPRIIKGRSLLVMDHPFFGSLIMRLRAVRDYSIPTMAVDGTNLFYNPKFLDKLSIKVLLFALAHETLHCALLHMTRRQGRDPKLWNIACDYVINWILKNAGFDVPDWVYIDAVYAKDNAEEVYAKQVQKQKDDPKKGKNPQPGSNPIGTRQSASGDSDPEADQGQATSHQPTSGDPGGIGEVLDAAPAHETTNLDEMAERWAVYAQQAANVARRAGKDPGFIQQVIEVLNNPKVDWRDVVRRFIQPCNTKDYSWSKLNRRLFGAGGYIAPGIVSDGVHHLVFGVDTSGSVNESWLQRFGCELQAALDEGMIDKITVVMTDTIVQHTATYERGEVIDFTVHGRGGTKFSPTFNWVEQNAEDPAALIYFTDLDCSDFGSEPPYPVLWAVPEEAMLWRSGRNTPFGEQLVLHQ